VDVKLRLGVLGAGRLGAAIASTWLARTGEPALIWNRRGSGARDSEQVRRAAGNWVAEWTKTLEAQSLAIAIPGNALRDLAEGNEQAREFTGNVFSAAASLSHCSLRRVFPRATVLCIAPFLIDGIDSIPMLVFRPDGLPLSRWLQAKAELDRFGHVDVVEDEETFSQVALLGAPWPVVVLSALHAAASAGLHRLPDQTAREIGRRIFFRAIQSLLTNAGSNGQPAAEVATPGGITERGLKSLGDVTSTFETVFKQMQARAHELRV
jgi:pyrroline-5-carboxylate reductase